MDATIATMREELSRLSGPARVPVLVRLGQEYGNRYWRGGPGTPTSLPHLSAAIDAMNEAYALMPAADPARRQVGAQLGWWLTARHGLHGSEEADRISAMAILGEARAYPGLPAVPATVVRLFLGILYLMRAVEELTPAAARGGFLGGRSPGARADASEAIRCLQEALECQPPSADIDTLIRSLLSIAESVLPMLTGDLARLDLSQMVAAMSALEQAHLQQNSVLFGLSGLGLPTPMTFALDLDPLDYPVLDAQGDPKRTSTIPPRRPAAVAVVTARPASSRQVARDRLAALAGNPAAPVWEQALALLDTGPEMMAVGDLDAFVAAAANAADAGTDGDPVETGLDCLLSAVGLCLRERRDGSGWADGGTEGDYRPAAELLLGAAAGIPVRHPAAAAVVEAVGALLDEARPFGGVIARIAGPMGSYTAGITSPTAVVAAFGELFATVTALATGAEMDPEPLALAVAAVPDEHASLAALSTAVGHARLAAAVRAGTAVAIAADPDRLTPVLDALLRDDVEALRAAADSLATTAGAPRIVALAGAACLELAIRAPVAGRADLAAAIGLLEAATRTLDSVSGRLLARSWWRLAQAYRERDAGTDAEASRGAGLAALRSGELGRLNAARFAGWLLTDGCAAEAYIALEIAARSTEREGLAADPLVEDVLDTILGIAPAAAPSPDVPVWTDVAAAVRKAGACALLYLHPTDEVGRTAGVLCIDAESHRLEVLANVPVADPLTSDDPGWSAVVGRWKGGLLVAASGNLRRIALPALRTGDGRRLAQDVSLAYVSSGAMVVDLAERPRVAVGKAPLFVVNPRGDRDAMMADVMVLQRLFYPRSTCVGRALEPVDGPGTREDLRLRVSDASLVHLACGLRGTELALSGAEVLEVGEVRGSGLVVLTEASTDGFEPAADAFLGAGFSGVIGWQWPVPSSFAALALFLTHSMLVDHRMLPAAAVNAVHRWMLEPDQDLPPLLPGLHRHTAETMDLTRPALWAALTYCGC